MTRTSVEDEAEIRLILRRRSAGAEERDLIVKAVDGLAFSSCLQRRPGGSWARVTLGWRKLDGRWTVAHEHVSAYRCSGGTSRIRAACAAISSAL